MSSRLAHAQDDWYDYADHDRSEMAGLIPAGAERLLDVGCSGGAFGAGLLQARPGLEVVGIEPSPASAARAAERLTRVVQGRFPDDLPDDAGRFDVITFNDALEHFPDPWVTLEACKVLLAPGGRVVLSIPNVRHVSVSVPLLVNGSWKYADEGLLDRTHLRFFTRQGILDLFADSGYQVQSIRPWNDGRLGKLVRRFGSRFDDLLCMHFAVSAVPA